MTKIEMDTRFCDIEAMPALEQFRGHLMVCPRSEWESISRASLRHFVPFVGSVQAERMLAGLRMLEACGRSGARSAYTPYDDQACVDDPSRADVRLFRFAGEPGAPFVVLAAGGGYRTVCSMQESFPAAAELVAAGYNAFVLSYRVGQNDLMSKLLEDLACAIGFVLDRADEFGVARRYGVWGWSAGAHLAAMWGTTRLGAARWGLPRARALVLSYPVIDFRTLADDGHGAGREDYLRLLLGDAPGGMRLEELAVQWQVDETYPATFIWQCADDDMVPPVNLALMRDALVEHGIRHEALSFGHGGHALRKPHGPEVDAWSSRALAFFDDVMGR